jgi:hypothetical protein
LLAVSRVTVKGYLARSWNAIITMYFLGLGGFVRALRTKSIAPIAPQTTSSPPTPLRIVVVLL